MRRSAYAVPAGILALAGCMILTGCGQAQAPRHAHRRSAVATSSQPQPGVMLLFPSGLGLVGTGSGPDGQGRAQLLETTNFGASFRLISPPTPRDTGTDDVWAVSRSRIWFDAYNPPNVRERLYWTSDGGRSWASTPVQGHSEAGGSDSLDFTSAREGWMVNQEPYGPGATLYHTSDGGAAWRVVTGGPPLPGLPFVAPVMADPGGGLWQAGGLVSYRLGRSTDGGRRWQVLNLTHARPVTGTSDSLEPGYSLPGIFPGLILAPVVVPHGGQQTLLVYASHTRGRSWTLISRLPRAGKPVMLGNTTEPIPVAFASRTTWWALDPGSRPRLFLTTDAGQHWDVVGLPAGYIASQVTAANARHAWVLAITRQGESFLLVTSNGGHTWHPASLRAAFRPRTVPSASASPTASFARTPAGSGIAWCRSTELKIRGGREGETAAGVHGDIEFTNVGARPCQLRGRPTVAILTASRRALPVRFVGSPPPSVSPVVLPPRRPDAADLVVFWMNWCGPRPGPLWVRVTLPGGITISGPFNGPPDYGAVPLCLLPHQPSTVFVIDAYQAAGAA